MHGFIAYYADDIESLLYLLGKAFLRETCYIVIDSFARLAERGAELLNS